VTARPGPTDIDATSFDDDRHGAKYAAFVRRHPDAFSRVFAVLNDPASERRMIDTSVDGEPALLAVVAQIEATPTIRAVLADDGATQRFRQAVGVAVKLKMERLRWAPMGKQASVARRAEFFKKAERFVPIPDDERIARQLAVLDEIAAIGSAEEQERDVEELMAALRATRAAEGRPF
jgi:hypothetical protein